MMESPVGVTEPAAPLVEAAPDAGTNLSSQDEADREAVLSSASEKISEITEEEIAAELERRHRKARELEEERRQVERGKRDRGESDGSVSSNDQESEDEEVELEGADYSEQDEEEEEDAEYFIEESEDSEDDWIPDGACFVPGCTQPTNYTCCYLNTGDPGCEGEREKKGSHSCRGHARRVCELCASWECPECHEAGKDERHTETDVTRHLARCGTCAKIVCRWHHHVCYMRCCGDGCRKVVCNDCPHEDWYQEDCEDVYHIPAEYCPKCKLEYQDTTEQP